MPSPVRLDNFLAGIVEAVEHEIVAVFRQRDGAFQQGGEVTLETALAHVGEHLIGERGDGVEVVGGR